jgi:hypothetical protein
MAVISAREPVVYQPEWLLPALPVYLVPAMLTHQQEQRPLQ